MLRTFLNSLKTHRNLLLAGALLGATAAACDPKQIGNETDGGNLVCQDGDTKEADDGCNTCTCQGGEWGCTLKDCDPGVCEDGESKPAPDGCNTCTCYDGSWACTEKACPATDGQSPECGDGVVQAPEECDDGNLMGSDGCSPECTIEGSDTEGSTTSDGTSGEPNETESTSTTSASTCGDSVVEGSETCDDGNLIDGDGCSSDCTLEGGPGQSCAEPAPADPFDVLEAGISGDTLLVEVKYSGGCIEHDFTYCWDGAFLESDPVQVHTKISHDDKGDNCDALPERLLQFSLADMKASYQAAYQQQSGEITIHLDGWPSSLSYVF